MIPLRQSARWRRARSCLAMSFLAMSCAASCGKDAPPNVVVIMIDTLRPDHTELYGYHRETAPYLSALGARSAVFTNAFSTSSWTAPATASLFTGLYPTRHGVVEGFWAHDDRQRAGGAGAGASGSLRLNALPREIPTLAQRFRERGYRTFGLAANVNVGEEMGFSRGFDRFACYPIADAAELLGYLTEWESEIGRSAPYFVYLHFMDPHTPYRRRAPWYEASNDEIEDLISRYDSDIRFLDEHLSRLPSLLELDRNTLLVVLSDHGEEFRDHGQIGHKFSLFSEVNRILLLIHAPQLGVAAQRIDRNVSLVDLVPTLMELSGASAPRGDGRSLVPLLRQEDDGAAFEERTVFAHRQQSTGRKREMWAAIRGGWKLLERDDPKTTRLYDLTSDPAEMRDVLREEPMVAAHLIDELVLLRAREVAGKPERIEVPVDPDRAALLRALGYMDDEPGAGSSDR